MHAYMHTGMQIYGRKIGTRQASKQPNAGNVIDDERPGKKCAVWSLGIASIKRVTAYWVDELFIARVLRPRGRPAGYCILYI